MAQQETVFEQTMRTYGEWDGQGEAPAYPLYVGQAVALVDKYPKFPGQVVVFPNTGNPGEDVSLYDIPTYRRLQVDTVANAIGRQIHRVFEGVRVIRHDEGYAVPDHPHAVLFPAARGEGIGLYQPNAFQPEPDYFSKVQRMLELDELQTRVLDSQLAHLATIAAVGDWT